MVIIVLFLVGLVFGYSFLYVMMNNNVYKIGKILFAIIFSIAIVVNIYMYIIAKDPELMVSMNYPISMSVGIFTGLLSFVSLNTREGRHISPPRG